MLATGEKKHTTPTSGPFHWERNQGGKESAEKRGGGGELPKEKAKRFFYGNREM